MRHTGMITRQALVEALAWCQQPPRGSGLTAQCGPGWQASAIQTYRRNYWLQCETLKHVGESTWSESRRGCRGREQRRGGGARHVAVHVAGAVAQLRRQRFPGSLADVGDHHRAAVRVEAPHGGFADACMQFARTSLLAVTGVGPVREEGMYA